MNGETHREPIVLNTPGRHNVLNALATIAIALECGAGIGRHPSGPGAVFWWAGAFSAMAKMPVPTGGSFTLVDDYGHHPVEMAATLRRARAFPGRRLVLAFQPHRYSRTRDLFEDFVRVLGTVDGVVD